MHVSVTGGSGLPGPAIVAELIAAGHTVVGLARSDDAASRLQGLGAPTRGGSLEDPRPPDHAPVPPRHHPDRGRRRTHAST